MSNGASIHPESGTATDFSSPVTYDSYGGRWNYGYQEWLVSIGLDPAVGIGTTHAEFIRVYPNPANEHVYIKLSRETRIRIYDYLGNLCYSEDDANGDRRIDVSEFETGIYIVSLYWEDGSLQQSKLIIQ